MAFYIGTNSPEITREIRLGGIPITLYKYSEQIINSLNSGLETVYAIGMIKKTNVSPIVITDNSNPSDPTTSTSEISYVWNGIRYAASQDSDGKLYFTAAEIYSVAPTHTMILEGIPIGLGSCNQMAFIDSGLSENSVEEYTAATIGGVPLTVGRIGNKYYLMVYEAITNGVCD